MGLFDFAKSIGKKVFGNEAEASTKIQDHIEQDNPGIDGLKVEVKDGVASISGKANSAAAAEKAILMTGNLEGIEKVNTSGLEQPATTEAVTFYEIKSGDTLGKIAKNFYDNASEYKKIFNANKEVIKDPDLIFVGQKIRIPA